MLSFPAVLRASLVLACLLRLGLGSRVQPAGRWSGGESRGKLGGRFERRRVKGQRKSLGALALLFLATDPASTFMSADELRPGYGKIFSRQPRRFWSSPERVSSAGPVARTSARMLARGGDWEPRQPWETAAMPTFDYQADSYQDLIEGMKVCRQHRSEIVPILERLQGHDFFSMFPFDLMGGSCKHMPTADTGCEIEQCEVDSVYKVPDEIVARDEQEYDFIIDGWIREDMPSDLTEYFDMRQQSERNTGYDGSRVWRFIHQKICFQEDLEEPESGWKRDFNRAVSGMHAAVDASIVADIGFNEEGLAEYRRRLRDEPGSIANLYFAYMLTLDAIRDIRDRLDNCNYLGDEAVQPTIRALTDSEMINADPVGRAALNLREHALLGKEGWKARLRMRELFSIMECVQCNLCRLHGKLMTLGLAATFQVLLGSDGRGGESKTLDRKQVGALVATAAKFGKACDTVERFRELDGDDMSKAFGEDRI